MSQTGPQGWRAEISVTVADRTAGPFLLPGDDRVTFGRAAGCGLRVDDARASRAIATFVPTEFGWIVINGDRTRFRASSLFVPSATVDRRAHFLLQPGVDWALSWDLDVTTVAAVTYRRDTHGEPLPVARDRIAGEPERSALVRRDGHIVDLDRGVGTDLAGGRLKLTESQIRALAALFAWIIEGRAKPDNMIAEASRRSGMTIPQINGVWTKIREYVNRHRDSENQIVSIEELGYHLVEVVGVIGPDDLPARPTYSTTQRDRA